MALTATELDAERSDLLAMLAQHRQFLRYTTRDLTDEQARARTTVSELTLGGLIKHVTDVERGWTAFVLEGPTALGDAAATTELVRTLPDLDATQPLPNAPWFPPSERWSARRVLLHIIAETAQHAGHADIIRESIDGQKTMG